MSLDFENPSPGHRMAELRPLLHWPWRERSAADTPIEDVGSSARRGADRG